MPPPAFERVPVEVWLRILRFALASPLSPDPGDDILDYRNVFVTGCDSDQVALANENNVASFRLVCKSWNTTVVQLRQTMILCNFVRNIKYGPGPSQPELPVPLHLFQKPTPTKLSLLTRVEAWTPNMKCCCFRSTCRYKKITTSRDHPARDLKEHLLVARHRGKSVSKIKSLLIGQKVDKNYFCNMLNAMPSLRALSCRLRDTPMWKTVFQRATCQRLTHLQVRMSWAPFCRSLSHVSLSELVYLGVTFHHPRLTSNNDNLPLADVNWRPQPKVRYLELEGMILKCRRAEFYAFLSVDRPSLSGLVLRVRESEYAVSEYLFPPDPWAPFPNLTSVGVEMATLLVRPLLPAPNTTPVDVILFFSTIHNWYYADTPTADNCFQSVREMCRAWKPRKVVLPTTWESEGQFVRGFELSTCKDLPRAFYLPNYARFFQVMKEEGIAVVDREGNLTETVDGRRYVELLETHGFDKYDTGPKIRIAWADSLLKVPFKPGLKGHTGRFVYADSDQTKCDIPCLHG